MERNDWTGKTVTCVDPVETDMFEGCGYIVTRDYGRDVCINIKGLNRLFLKSRFVDPFRVLR